MKVRIDQRILGLVSGPIHWFADAPDSGKLIRDRVSANAQGVYCLWWRNPKMLPLAPRVELDAGSRGTITVELKLHTHGLCDAAAMYVGKGAIRSRLASHIKPKAESGRNPYWWVTQVAKGIEGEESFRTHLGFSFVVEPSRYEQIYAENLGIGILRPWFNLRLTS